MSSYSTLKAILVVPDITGTARSHAQSNSNARLTLACETGKTQSYFSKSKWRLRQRERAAEQGDVHRLHREP